MPLVVRAEVIDLRTDSPKANDVFVVDINVWYWLTYAPASHSAQPYQSRQYPNYLKRAKTAGVSLRYCGTVYAEITHLIEKAEYEAFCLQQATHTDMQKPLLKDFRHTYPIARRNVREEVGIAWGQVTSMANIATVPLDAATVDSTAALFDQVRLDGYDLLAIEAMRQNGIKHIITDDKDFLTVPDIVVLTANNNAIQSAQTAGKLITR